MVTISQTGQVQPSTITGSLHAGRPHGSVSCGQAGRVRVKAALVVSRVGGPRVIGGPRVVGRFGQCGQSQPASIAGASQLGSWHGTVSVMHRDTVCGGSVKIPMVGSSMASAVPQKLQRAKEPFDQL